MPTDRKHYTEAKRVALAKARARMAAVRTRKAQQKVNIRFYGDESARARVDAACQMLHGMSFAMWCKTEWTALEETMPKPPRRKRIEELSARELFFEQFPVNDRLYAETAIAMSEYMEPGETMTASDVLDACEVDQASRAMTEYHSVGRVMKGLRWTRCKIKRDDKWIWAYRKPQNALIPPPENG